MTRAMLAPMKPFSASVVLACALSLAACASVEQQQAVTMGGVQGAAVGAAVGARNNGALSGAVLGGVIGATTAAVFSQPQTPSQPMFMQEKQTDK